VHEPPPATAVNILPVVAVVSSGPPALWRRDASRRSRAATAGFREALFLDFALQKTEARVNDELSLIEARLKCADESGRSPPRAKNP
jgi:hypothetical protein